MIRIIRNLAIAATFGTMLCQPAHAATKPWQTLTPTQQEALAPIAHEWGNIPEKQQKRLLATTKRYPKLSPDQQQRFRTRLTEWSQLTPEQREHARAKYKAFSKVPPDKRAEVKRRVLQSEAEKLSASTAGGVAPVPEK